MSVRHKRQSDRLAMTGLKTDVRLVKNADKHWGLERNGRVLWLPPEFADLDLQSTSIQASLLAILRDTLREYGFLKDAGERAPRSLDRNHVFLSALVGEAADRCTDFLRATEFVIVGCGGLGASTAIQLAALGARRYLLIDGDAIEHSNLNRLLHASVADVGDSKVAVLARYLADRFGVRSRAIQRVISEEVEWRASRAQSQFGILTVDDPDAAKLCVRAFARPTFVPYIHGGYTGARCVMGPLVDTPHASCPFCGANQLVAYREARQVTSPSSAMNNQLTAGLLVSQILRWSVGLAVSNTRHVLDLKTMELTAHPLRIRGCSICANYRNGRPAVRGRKRK